MATTLIKKLRLQPGHKALIVNAPETYLALLDPLLSVDEVWSALRFRPADAAGT